VPAFTGPRLSCFVCGRRSLDELRNAFAELWDIGRDVHDVVAAALGNLDAAAVSGA
jgi:hypothetical protein